MMSRRGGARASWAGVLVSAAAVALLAPTSAVQAATPAEICNAQSADGALEYTQNAVGWPQSLPDGGQVFLFYEGNLGQNCAVTIGSGAVDVGLRRADGTQVDWGTGTGQSGPAYVRAKGECVQITASSNGRSRLFPVGNCNE